MKLSEDKIRREFEKPDIYDFEVQKIEWNEKGWWLVCIKTFYGCTLNDLIKICNALEVELDDVSIAPMCKAFGDYLGFEISIFE